MARKLKDANGKDEGGYESNAQARDVIIQECASSMRDIKRQRAELNEEAAGIRERLKNAGINKAAFEAALRIADMDDDAARDDYLDGLRENFRAMGIGFQAEMFDREKMGGSDGEEDVRPEFLKQQQAEREAEAAE